MNRIQTLKKPCQNVSVGEIQSKLQLKNLNKIKMNEAENLMR